MSEPLVALTPPKLPVALHRPVAIVAPVAALVGFATLIAGLFYVVRDAPFWMRTAGVVVAMEDGGRVRYVVGGLDYFTALVARSSCVHAEGDAVDVWYDCGNPARATTSGPPQCQWGRKLLAASATALIVSLPLLCLVDWRRI